LCRLGRAATRANIFIAPVVASLPWHLKEKQNWRTSWIVKL
jgi:hypothetical protein